MIPILRAPVSLCAVFFLVGCGGGSPTPPPEQTPAPSAPPAERVRLLAFVGAASKPPATEAKEVFEKANPDLVVDMTFGGSGTILNQMMLEQTGDIYMPGSNDYMDKAEAKKAVLPETRRIVAYLVPMICVRRGNPKHIHSLADLARPGVTVGLAEAGAVCLGDASDFILRKAGLEKQVKQNVITYAKSCDQTQQLIQLGEVDAVIGWDAFKAWSPNEIDVVPIPELQPPVYNIPAAVAVYSKHRAEAERFIAFLTSDEGKAIFAKHGYCVTMPEPRREPAPGK